MSVRFRVGLGMVAALFAVTPVAGQSVARVTVGHNGAQPDGSHGVGVVSGDGRFVAFVSQATNLVASDTNGGAADVFVRDLAAATTTLVSLASDGLQRSGHSGALYNGGINITTQEHDISNDGRFVVFMSRAALVPADTGECTIPPDVAPANCPDIYLRDRQTNETVRISVAAGGANPNGPSLRPRISGDGRFVVFESSATNLVAGQTGIFLADRNTGTLSHVGQGLSPSISDNGALIGFLSTSSQLVAEPDPVACQPFPGDTQIVVCFRPFIFDRVLGETRRVPMPAIATEGVQPGSTPLPYTVRVEASSVVPSADGLSVAVGVRTSSTVRRNGIPIIDDRGWIYDRVRGRIAFDQIHLTPTAWTGSLLAYQAYTQGLLGVSTDVWAVGLVDQGPGLHETLPGGSTAALMGNVSDSGRFATYRTIAAVTGEPPDPEADVYVFDRDHDGDGMPSAWETLFGFDPALSTDAGADADTDGVTNLAEYMAGSHPTGTHARYLAEGAANSFFATQIDIANPGTSPAPLVVRFQGDDGRSTSSTWQIPAGAQRTISRVGSVAASFSTVVESSGLVVVDRTMTWGGGYGSHAETALAAPSTTWFLAEGATHGRFSLFYLLQNPGAAPATVAVTYLRPAPAAPVTRQYTLAAASRLTIAVDGIAELAATDVSAQIASDVPILVERAMYVDTLNPVQTFGAGHAGAGVTATSTRWFLAEGATGSFFDLYYLIANPSSQATTARVSYLLPSGVPIVRDYAVPAQSRVTISVDGEDDLLADTPVSAIVESTTSVGLVVERSMWWPGQGQWTEGHLSAGSTVAARRWALAAGAVNPSTDTYVLIANTSATAGTVTLRTLPSGTGVPALTHTLPILPDSRVSVSMSQFAQLTQDGGSTFGTLIESDGPNIVVERAMYTTVGDIVWSAGTAALGTPLP